MSTDESTPQGKRPKKVRIKQTTLKRIVDEIKDLMHPYETDNLVLNVETAHRLGCILLHRIRRLTTGRVGDGFVPPIEQAITDIVNVTPDIGNAIFACEREFLGASSGRIDLGGTSATCAHHAVQLIGEQIVRTISRSCGKGESAALKVLLSSPAVLSKWLADLLPALPSSSLLSLLGAEIRLEGARTLAVSNTQAPMVANSSRVLLSKHPLEDQITLSKEDRIANHVLRQLFSSPTWELSGADLVKHRISRTSDEVEAVRGALKAVKRDYPTASGYIRMRSSGPLGPAIYLTESLGE